MAETTDPVKRSESLPVPGLPPDWHVLATDKLVSVVDTVKVKSAGPAIKVSRALVFGIMGAIIAIFALLMFLVGLVRALNNFIPAGVWLVYIILGTLFMLVGALLWSKRPRGAAS